LMAKKGSRHYLTKNELTFNLYPFSFDLGTLLPFEHHNI
jgi:hypothetical protein